MLTLKSQFIVHTLFVVLCTLVLHGGTQVLQAFPPAENIDFSEKYKQLLQEAKSTSSKGYLKEVAFDAIETGQAAIKAGDYSAAVKIATLAVKIGKSSGNNHAYTLANNFKQRSGMLAREYRKVENFHKNLQKDPKDSRSAFLYGKFVALKLNHWKEGLDWLSKGDDAAYRTLAEQELAILKDDDSLLEVANGWYQLGGEEKGLTKQELELHAYDLYSRAWTHSIEADRTTINARLSEMPLRYLNHMEEQDVIRGPWAFGKNGDAGNGGIFTVNKIEFPNGLGLVPQSRGLAARVRYQLDGQYKTFVTGMALMDHSYQYLSTITFTVLGDDRVLWKSPPIRGRGDAVFCNVSVKNIKRLEIRTETPGRNLGGHAVWLDPLVLK
ncbi:NPCBM/NEW2 domain-containing protein [uncultured Gimesia sp.]|uniref:NPCBM/NEW2 domain-containing protein n=1 Tax=uncultured Gimesia sp. TaxID=1678688 RepID=UPI002620E744|nr:NPCBM/NEW2 domain-containing protein [uncultured Gimesia sp.]